jgi:hypothetical protein
MISSRPDFASGSSQGKLARVGRAAVGLSAVLCLLVGIVSPISAAVLPGTSASELVATVSISGAAIPDTTVSRYESTAEPAVLAAQGVADGTAGLSGVAVLDFGRPAESIGEPATLDFGTHLDPLSTLVDAVNAYADGYRSSAPRGSSMRVILGTNDSCGTGQPCGSGMCGCVNEPSSFVSWGRALGRAVTEIGNYLSATASTYSAIAGAGGGDDAEPAYDPAFTNTYDVLAGYDDVTALPMIDYGSIDGGPVVDGFWTPEQMYLVANGLRPDAALPEIYHPGMASQWADLALWAATNAGGRMPFAGVLTQAPDGYSPIEGAAALSAALKSDFPHSPQTSWDWSSNMETGT